jgi:hypothetical protein
VTCEKHQSLLQADCEHSYYGVLEFETFQEDGYFNYCPMCGEWLQCPACEFSKEITDQRARVRRILGGEA